MILRVRRTAASLIDLIETADYIAKDTVDASARFLQSAENTFARLAERPGLGTVLPADNKRLAEIRKWPIPAFSKYLVIYQPTERELVIVRFLHGARDIDRILEIETDEE